MTELELRKIDILVANHVMGYETICYGEDESAAYYHAPDGTCGSSCKGHQHIIPYYSTDLNDARTVIEKVGNWNGFEFQLLLINGRWHAGWYEDDYDGGRWRAGGGPTDNPALAICLAALETQGRKKQEPVEEEEPGKNFHDNYDAEFAELKGKTLTKIEGKVGDGTLLFHTAKGDVYQLHYYEDCCASCSVEDICGDLEDLIGSEILLAEEVCSNQPSQAVIAERKAQYEKELSEFKSAHSGREFHYYGPNPENNWMDESETWSFYKLSTIKGSVTIRWYGSSNGYYSETATFERLGKAAVLAHQDQ